MIYRYKSCWDEIICRQGICSGANLRGEAQQENYWKLQTMTPTTPLIPSPFTPAQAGEAGIHLDILMDSRLRTSRTLPRRCGSERSAKDHLNYLLGVAGIRAIIAPINIRIMVASFAHRRMTCGMIAKPFAILFVRIERATYFMNLMFTSRLRVFIYTIISHLALHKNEAGLTTEPISDSKKLPYLFSAPASKLMQIWKMSESSRGQPWRFVFPSVTVNADSHLATSPYLKYKNVHICSNLYIACGKVALGRTIQ